MSVFQFVQRHASGELVLVFGQQQSAVRRDVVARKIRQFLIEVLEAEAEAERSRVFEEKFAGLRDLRGRLGLQELD